MSTCQWVLHIYLNALVCVDTSWNYHLCQLSKERLCTERAITNCCCQPTPLCVNGRSPIFLPHVHSGSTGYISSGGYSMHCIRCECSSRPLLWAPPPPPSLVAGVVDRICTAFYCASSSISTSNRLFLFGPVLQIMLCLSPIARHGYDLYHFNVDVPLRI